MSNDSNYVNILAQVKAIVVSATVGTNVYDYERWAVHTKDILDLFKYTFNDGEETEYDVILGWTISRTATREIERSSGEHERIHTFTIRGYMGLDDTNTSEKTFQEYAENICNAFRTNRNLSNTSLCVKPVQLIRLEQVMFCGILAHYAEMTVDVHEFIDNF